MSKVYIIAEAGVNHNGDLDTAKKMIKAAKEAGADAVKFQTFVPKNIVMNSAEKAEYQKINTEKVETQKEMLEKLALSFDTFLELKKQCDELKIDFLSTPFDEDSIHFLNTITMPFWKIPSGEITNLPYLVQIAKTKKPIVLSTGMCTLKEIEETINLLYKKGCPKITLLQCNTQYPTPYKDVNLNVMNTYKEIFNVEVGYSDHTLGIEVPLAAVAMGAVIIEKHFTLDKTMSGPDHKASLEPAELDQMIKSIRNIELAIGKKDKNITDSECNNIEIVRKSIVAKKDIKLGDIFTSDNITTKRPGTGISPMKWFDLIGKKAIRDFMEDEYIEDECIEDECIETAENKEFTK